MTALALMYTGQQPELSRVHSSPGARLPDWLAAGHFCVHSIKKMEQGCQIGLLQDSSV